MSAAVAEQVIKSPYGKFAIKTAQDAQPPHLMRFFGTGATNSGKSHLVASIGPRCLVIDIEDKHRLIDFPGRSAYYVPRTMQELDSLLLDILADGPKANRPYDMIVWDTADEFIPFVIEGMTRMMKDGGLKLPEFGDATDYGSGGGKGSKGWKLVNDRFASYLRRTQQAGYGWGMVSHLKEETVTVVEGGKMVERTRLSPMLNPGILRPVLSLSLVKFQTFTRVVSRPTTRKLVVQGVEKTVAGEPVVETEFALTYDSKEQGAVGLGGNIPLRGTYQLPKYTGWKDAVVAPYIQALTERAPTGASNKE